MASYINVCRSLKILLIELISTGIFLLCKYHKNRISFSLWASGGPKPDRTKCASFLKYKRDAQRIANDIRGFLITSRKYNMKKNLANISQCKNNIFVCDHHTKRTSFRFNFLLKHLELSSCHRNYYVDKLIQLVVKLCFSFQNKTRCTLLWQKHDKNSIDLECQTCRTLIKWLQTFAKILSWWRLARLE